MKWLVALYIVSAVAAVLVLANRNRLRQLKHFLVQEQLPERTAADAITPVAKDPERHREFLNRIKQGDIDVLFLGDSITDSFPRVGEWSWLRLAKYRPANFGVSGDCTEHLLWRIQQGELDGIDPKVVIVLIGTNNIGKFEDEKPEWVAQGIQQILQTIRSRLPRTKILLLGIFPRNGKNSTSRKAVAEVNSRVQNFADGRNAIFEDFGAEFVDSSGELREDLVADGLHLTAKGYQVWYNRLEPVLARLTQ